MCGVTREPVNKQRASCFIQHGKFLFLGTDWSAWKEVNPQGPSPSLGLIWTTGWPRQLCPGVRKAKQTDPCPHSLSCSDVSISRLAGCWEVGSCHQNTSISSAQRVSSLAVSANEMHSWDWQAAVVPGLIDACVPPLRNWGKQENLRSVPELEHQLPSTECTEQALMQVPHQQFRPRKVFLHFCFPSQLTSCTSRTVPFGFASPLHPVQLWSSSPSTLVLDSAPSCHSEGWHFWKTSRCFSYFYSAWHKVDSQLSWLCFVRSSEASILPCKNTPMVLETPALALVLLMRSRKTHSA